MHQTCKTLYELIRILSISKYFRFAAIESGIGKLTLDRSVSRCVNFNREFLEQMDMEPTPTIFYNKVLIQTNQYLLGPSWPKTDTNEPSLGSVWAM